MKPFLVVIAVLVGSLFLLSRVPIGKQTESISISSQNDYTAPVSINLGTRSDTYGTTWQAQELASAISRNQRARSVTITATDPAGETLEFTADLANDTLFRKHGKTFETWKGHAIDRLSNAAKGGSLNSTN